MLSTNFSKYTTKGLDSLASNTIQITKRNVNPDVSNNPLFAVLTDTAAEYNRVVIKKTYSGKGTDVREKDMFRDRYHTSAKMILTGFSAFPTPKGKVAGKLLEVFDSSGSITRLKYTDESVILNDLLKKLDQQEAKELISILGIDEELAVLDTTQKEFEKLFVEQVDANSDLRQQPSASSLRNELEDALRNYFNYVSSLKKQKDWKDIYSDLTELLKKS